MTEFFHTILVIALENILSFQGFVIATALAAIGCALAWRQLVIGKRQYDFAVGQAAQPTTVLPASTPIELSLYGESDPGSACAEGR